MIHQHFVTWRSRLATAPDTPTCIVIQGGQFTGGVHPPNQFVPEIVSPLPCSPTHVRHILLIVYFFKELISFIDSLDKCHTSVFNALIISAIRLLQTFIFARICIIHCIKCIYILLCIYSSLQALPGTN